MISIQVARYAGGTHGEDITDPLIGSIPCAVSRGRAELDRNAQAVIRVSLSVLPDSSYRSGQLIEVRDQDQGAPWRGKIVGVAYTWSGPADEQCKLEVERYAD